MALGNGERYYSPNLARFIQQDRKTGSAGMPQTMNRFSYAINNPNKYTDPSGNEILTTLAIMGVVAVVSIVWSKTDLAKSQHELQAVEQNWEKNDARRNWGSAFADGVGMTQAFKGFTGTDPYKGSVDAREGKPGRHRAWDAGVGSAEVILNAMAISGPAAAVTNTVTKGAGAVEASIQAGVAWGKNTGPLVQESVAVVNAIRHPVQTGRSVTNFIAESYQGVRSSVGALKDAGARQLAKRSFEFVKNRLNPKNYELDGWNVNFKGGTNGGRTTIASASEEIVGAESAAQSVSSLTKRQLAIHEALSEPGAMAQFAKKRVSMADLRAIGRVTKDEYSMFTLKGTRTVIRGSGRNVVVSEELASALVTGKYGKWSGHTHPPGYSLTPGPGDRPFLQQMGQNRSGIWGDDGYQVFGSTAADDVMINTEISRQKNVRYYGSQE